ncbi:MAG: hypothetical protein CFE26_17610, partial [Verrucomicrobiales bacterium VVV1]
MKHRFIPSNPFPIRKLSMLPAVALFSLAVLPVKSAILLADDFTNAVRVGGTNARTGVDRDGVATLTNDWVMAYNSTTTANQPSDTNAPNVAP